MPVDPTSDSLTEAKIPPTDVPVQDSARRPANPFKRLALLYTGKAAQEGYLAAIDQGVISLANFLATLILARNVTPTELGVYGVGFTSLRLVRAVQEGLIIQPLNTFGAPMEEEEFRRYATSTSLIQVGYSLAIAAVAALFGWVLTRLGNDTAGPGLFWLWANFLWWQLQEYLRRVYYTRGRVQEAVFNSILANLARLIFLVVWASQGKLTGVAGLQAIAWGSLIAIIPALWQTRSYWTRHFENLRITWGRNWHFGRWVMGGQIASWLSVEFYPVLTAGMISFAAAGAYRALQNLVAPIHLLLRATDTFLTPRASRQYQFAGFVALNRLLRRTYLVIGIPVLFSLGLAAIFSNEILSALYGETYLSYSQGMAWMAFFYALLYAYSPLQTVLKAAQITRPIFVANALAFLAMFTIGLWAIQRWGVYGTIAGQALNALIVTIVLWAAWIRARSKH